MTFDFSQLSYLRGRLENDPRPNRAASGAGEMCASSRLRQTKKSDLQTRPIQKIFASLRTCFFSGINEKVFLFCRCLEGIENRRGSLQTRLLNFFKTGG
ncbi:hypothetical protein HNY73_003636 [Argiope bruennichi]|uniref:Uncharacterized protein n=1 Tax=Argiope bruennichi TaxID=94029 RepID=A0A8T0FLS3_ARGBR|nr:hypothetical protein HNY73_003636 [Argiope bruennichi]